MVPHARQEQLIVQAVMDETLIYDLRSHRAHCLNQTAAFVWRSSDGKTSVAGLAGKLRAQDARFASAADSSMEEVVALALQQLDAVGLLNPQPAPASAARLSRREVARHLSVVGGLAVLVPAITSITAPTPAMAASPTCIPNGRTCTMFDTCCSGKACNAQSAGRCNG